jgi:hypothetical protein
VGHPRVAPAAAVAAVGVVGEVLELRVVDPASPKPATP